MAGIWKAGVPCMEDRLENDFKTAGNVVRQSLYFSQEKHKEQRFFKQGLSAILFGPPKAAWGINMEHVILVVDDDKNNLLLAQKIFGKKYRIAAAVSGIAAFKYLEKNKPDLILLDINMPGMDGFEVMEKLKGDDLYKQIPVVFLTADDDSETETRCFRAGARDFVRKPFVADVAFSRIDRVLELEDYHKRLEIMVAEQAEEIERNSQRISSMQEQAIIGMANLIELRDDSTGMHVKNTKKYVEMIAGKLVKEKLYSDILTDSYIKNMCKAAPLHDIGKIRISDLILQKPGRLTEEEFAEMKKHTVYGSEIIYEIMGGLEDDNYIKIAAQIAEYHHERWDGTGYPEGLAGEDIPLCARIMAFADVFDALYAERCYKKPVRPVSKVLGIIEEGKGTQFDPVITDVFLSLEADLKKEANEEQEGEWLG